MRRLTLILSDLYLPAEAAESAPPEALDLPNLDWLLCFASAREPIGDWRSWLARELGAAQFAALPPAHAVAAHRLGNDRASGAWLATPVRLEVRIDHVRLADRGVISLAPAQRAELVQEFARHFGPECALHEAGPRGFLLTGARAERARTVDPARLLDADLGAAIPSGADSGQLRRLAAEIEMWLHRSPINAALEGARRPRVSALWLWGGGSAGPEARRPDGLVEGRYVFHGEDPWLAACADHITAREIAAPPGGFAALTGTDHAIVELTPMSGERRDSLGTVEAQWFAGVRAALAAGSLESVDLIANDIRYRIAARPAWRIWRRRAPWLAVLKA
jgi:hypothetical protein